jgi:CHASE3 domain sensor protein
MPAPGGGPTAPLPGPEPLAPVTRPGPLGQLGSLVRLDTLAGQFGALAILAALLSLLAMGVSFWVLNSADDNFRRVVRGSTPSIIAAEELGQNFNALDTAAADFQVTTRIDVTSPDFNPGVYGENGLRTLSDQRYLQYRQALNDALYRARNNITYQGEADAINIISIRLFDYLARIEVMRNEISQGHREAALAQYKAAHDILVGNLEVNSDGTPNLTNGRSPEEILAQNGWKDLDVNKQYKGINANIAKLLKINQTELSKASDAVINTAFLNLVLVVVTIVLVLGVALWLSIRYALVTHRIVNPGFVIGLLLSVGILVWLASSLFQASNDYKTVSRESFLTINAASQAKQALLDYKGDESRLLLSANSSGLDSTNPNLTSAVKQAFDPAILSQNFETQKKLVEDQLKLAWTSASPAERKALCAIYDNPSGTRCATSERPTQNGAVLPFAWTEYLNQHQQIVDQFNKGLLADAIKISFGPSTTQEQRVSDGLDALAQVNKDAFDAASCNAIGQAEFKPSCGNTIGYLNSLETANWIIFPVIAVLALGGAWYARRLL